MRQNPSKNSMLRETTLFSNGMSSIGTISSNHPHIQSKRVKCRNSPS